MTEKREMLRHCLAAIAYRLQKALRGMPKTFPAFSAGSKTRTPHQLVCHITNVLGYARTHFIGGSFPSEVPTKFEEDVATVHRMLEGLSRHLAEGTPLRDTTEERLLQGPFSDAMTHVGQIAMLRRLAGSPIPPEDFIVADVSADNLGPQQADPLSPDADWPERPVS